MAKGDKCRECGCTDEAACMTDLGPCSWTNPTLCSACSSPMTILVDYEVPEGEDPEVWARRASALLRMAVVAPELYAALERLVGELDERGIATGGYDEAVTALAAARGETVPGRAEHLEAMAREQGAIARAARR